MAKHTRGLWQRNGSHIYGPDPERRLICQLHYEGRGAEHEDAGNERLVPAAPELLEALKAARQEFDECCADTEGTPTQKHFAELLARCDAAIAKAEGPQGGAKP